MNRTPHSIALMTSLACLLVVWPLCLPWVLATAFFPRDPVYRQWRVRYFAAVAEDLRRWAPLGSALGPLAWNVAASVGSAGLGLALACGLCALHVPAVLAATIGTAVYVATLLQIVK